MSALTCLCPDHGAVYGLQYPRVVEVVVGILYLVSPSAGTQCSYSTASAGSIPHVRQFPQVITTISSKDFSIIVLQH